MLYRVLDPPFPSRNLHPELGVIDGRSQVAAVVVNFRSISKCSWGKLSVRLLELVSFRRQACEIDS